MLIVGAYDRGARSLALIVAGLSKITFIVLVLAHGGRFLGYQAGVAVVIDSIEVALFAAYLVAAPPQTANAGPHPSM